MNIVVVNIAEGIAYYQELTDWVRSFDIDPDDRMFDALSLMEGDPNKIKCDGNEMYFIDVDINGTKYIITSDEVNAEEKEMLKRFHEDDVQHYYTSCESNWKVFESLPRAIAFRGGKGYFYHIWKYTPEA